MTKHLEAGKEHGDRPALEIEITNDMVEAGLDALYRSGAVETPLESDELLVSEIYRSMANHLVQK